MVGTPANDLTVVLEGAYAGAGATAAAAAIKSSHPYRCTLAVQVQ